MSHDRIQLRYRVIMIFVHRYSVEVLGFTRANITCKVLDISAPQRCDIMLRAILVWRLGRFTWLEENKICT